MSTRPGGDDSTPTVPRVRSILWVAQWFAVVLLPVWLVAGTEWVLPHSWAVIGMVIYALFLFVMLLVPAILSVAIRTAWRRSGGPYYVWLLLGAWVCVAMLPFLAADLFEGYTPSALERVGLAPSINAVLYQSCFWGGAGLIALAWIAALAVAAPPPLGEGAPRKRRPTRQQILDRFDELNSWRP